MIVFIKSEEEIEGFKEVGKITGEILRTLINQVKEGITTNDLDIITRKECVKYNVTPTFLNYKNYPATICTSINNVLVHGIPDNTKLKNGDKLTIDLGITKNGYIGDSAETCIVGEEDNKIILSCREALYSAISKAREGNRLSKISEEIYKLSKKYKYSVPEHYGGHGIDRWILHASPFVSNIPDYKDDLDLREGMILAIEPMFIDSDSNKLKIKNKWEIVAKGSTAHCEHTILITKQEPIILTRTLSGF